MSRMIKTAASILISTILLTLSCVGAFALEANNLSEGKYSVDSSLNCYVNAMGGVEFGNPLLTDSYVTVNKDGSKTMTLTFTKSSVTIYSVTCDTFVDIDPSNPNMDRGVMSGVIGYYDKNGEIKDAEYTLSDDTALNSANEAVHYVDSMTFTLDEINDVYNLTMYINSNVTGVQFCEENDKATAATYTSRLTVDWNTLREYDGASASSKKQSDTDFETLPPATAAATEEPSAYAGEVVEKDGLNIHYANGASENNSDSEKAQNSNTGYFAHLNMPALIVLICIASAVIIAGIVLLLSTKFEVKKRDK